MEMGVPGSCCPQVQSRKDSDKDNCSLQEHASLESSKNGGCPFHYESLHRLVSNAWPGGESIHGNTVITWLIYIGLTCNPGGPMGPIAPGEPGVPGGP